MRLGGSDRANFQSFANDLTDLLGVQRPDPATAVARRERYCFERRVNLIHTGSQTRGFIGPCRAGHFVMEAKHGTEGAKPEPDAKPDLLPCLPPKQRQGNGGRG